MDYKMVIVTRNNLKLSPGKLAAQVAHAAVLCALITKKKKPRWFKRWMEEGGKKVVLKVEQEKNFYILKKLADDLGIATEIVTDAGLTEVPPGTKTVLGIGPAPSNLVDKITGDLPLL